MILAYDIETYPNFFSVVFVNVDNVADRWVFHQLNNKGNLSDIRDFLAKEKNTLVGFNNLMFDNRLLNYILSGGSISQAYHIAQEIISNHRSFGFSKSPVPYDSIDIMRMMGFNRLGVSLKRAAISIKWPTIEGLPYEPGREIRPEEVSSLLDYNLNDTLVTAELYKHLKKEIKFRQELSELYGIDLVSSSDSQIANEVLSKVYPEMSGVKLSELTNLRTPRLTIKAKACISPVISFSSDKLRGMLDEIKGMTLRLEDNFKFKLSISLADKTFDIGIGGLHSRDEGGVFVSSEDETIIDCDVSSYYPNIMLLNGIKPKHLESSFSDVLGALVAERLEAKKSGHKTKAQGLKITVNSIFGKSGHDKFWLYDPKAFISVTLNGQLYLLMLIERLHNIGIRILSANTDGLITIVKKSQEKGFHSVCRTWCNDTGFDLKYVEYSKYVRRDVNNYIAVKRDGEIKQRGIFETQLNLRKSYKMPVVSEALNRYFIDDTPIEKTIGSSDIHGFLMSERTSVKFDVILRQHNTEIEVPRVNRFFVARRGGYLLKKRGDKEIAICAGWPVQVLNHVNDLSSDSYDVDYAFYREEARKVIRGIEPRPQNIRLF